MNLTDLANARDGFSSEMQSLLTVVNGTHTSEQRTAALQSATTECFTLCKTAKAVRVANPNSIETKAFYARPDLPLCELMDGYHINLGGTRMYEMFCTIVKVPQRGTCGTIPTKPTFPEGPLVLQYLSGPDTKVYLYQFQGTIEYQDGSTVNYDVPTDIISLNIPDDLGEGYGTIMLRGTLADSNTYGRQGISPVRDIVDCWQWGTECVIQDYSSFFLNAANSCFTVSATDMPKFGSHPEGEYGTSMYYMFGLCGGIIDPNIEHWDVSRVTNMQLLFNYTGKLTCDLSEWDVSSVTNMAFMFAGTRAFTQDLNTWDVSNVGTFQAIFENSDYGGDITLWDVSGAYNMDQMFRQNQVFNRDLSGWNPSPTATHGLFRDQSALAYEHQPAIWQ